MGVGSQSQSAARALAIIQASTLVTLFHCSWYTAFYFSVTHVQVLHFARFY